VKFEKCKDDIWTIGNIRANLVAIQIVFASYGLVVIHLFALMGPGF